MKRTFIFIFVALISLSAMAPGRVNAQVTYSNDKAILLETVGSTASSSLYMSYLALAAAYSSLEKQDSIKDFNDMIDPVIESSNQMMKNFERIVKECKLHSEDIDFLRKMNSVCLSVIKTSKDLKRYALTKSDSDRDDFLKSHDELGNAISELYGNDPKKDD